MITMKEARAEMASLSLALERADQEHTAEWGEEEMSTVVMGNFADVFAHEFATLPADVRQRVLDTIEKLMVVGDDMVQTAVATGFLEALLNKVDKGVVDRDTIESMLGPESLAYWKAWDAFSNNPYQYEYDELKEKGLLQSKEAEKYAAYLEQWLADEWYSSTERTEVERVLQELRNAMKGDK